MEKFMTIREAAKVKNVTRQAVYLAVRNGRIRTYQIGNLLKVYSKDIEEYDRSRFSRTISVLDGEKVFDDDKGLISINKASQLLDLSRNRVYYALRMGYLKSIRKGSAWVVSLKDLNEFRKCYLENNLSPMRIEYRNKAS